MMNTQNKNLLFRCVLLLSFSSVLINCGGTVYINASPRHQVKDKVLPFVAGKSVALINEYTSLQQAVIYQDSDGTKWIGDLRQYTDTVITILQSELKQREVFIENKHFKTLSLKISDVHATNQAFDKTTTLKLTVTLGNGKSTTITASYRTAGTARHALDGAIIAAVSQLLKSDTVVGYINK